ncbi:hypothetical protein [Methylobacter sp. sgz302048]|uniref:hypothetical protein n=1 Tax=Methylobacter sp. sgz302048 TaxID=3455945 RepID=UPI003FA004E3
MTFPLLHDVKFGKRHDVITEPRRLQDGRASDASAFEINREEWITRKPKPIIKTCLKKMLFRKHSKPPHASSRGFQLRSLEKIQKLTGRITTRRYLRFPASGKVQRPNPADQSKIQFPH